MRDVKINVTLYEILVEGQLNDFSVIELRDTFISTTESGGSKDQIRRFVYGYILRLQRLKLLVRIPQPTSKKPIYRKTEEFMQVHWSLTSDPLWNQYSYKESVSKMQEALRKRLENCRHNHLTYKNECQTYKNLSNDFPSLASGLSNFHSRAEENTLKMVGEINAIKIALSLVHNKPS